MLPGFFWIRLQLLHVLVDTQGLKVPRLFLGTHLFVATGFRIHPKIGQLGLGDSVRLRLAESVGLIDFAYIISMLCLYVEFNDVNAHGLSYVDHDRRYKL